MSKPKEILTNLLNNVAAEENIENPDFKIQAVTCQGVNYTSSIYKAVISAPDRADLKLFGKVGLSSVSVRKLMQTDRLYETERFVYYDLAAKYDELQIKNGIPEEDRFKFPTVYACNSNYLQETLVLEDLESKGYAMFDRFKPINWEYASKAIEELGKLHALSFAYKQDYPEEYKNNYDKLVAVEDSHEVSDTFWESTITASIEVLPDNLKDRLIKFFERMNDEMFNKQYNGPGKWPAIIHGDYRNSNIFFKRHGGKVKSLIPVDYQTIRLGSPILDIHYFVYSGTDGEFRKLHLKQLLDHYYGAFSRFLRQLNVDPNKHYSRADFDEDYKEYLPHGLSTTIFLLPIVLMDSEVAPNVTEDNADAGNFAVQPNAAFSRRFNEIFEEFIEMGVV